MAKTKTVKEEKGFVDKLVEAGVKPKQIFSKKGITVKDVVPDKEKEKKNHVHIEGKDITKEEFTRYVRPCGSSAHVGLSKHWVNKYVHVVIEEVKE